MRLLGAGLNSPTPKTKHLKKISLCLCAYSLVVLFFGFSSTAQAASQPEDINGDNVVNIIDFSILASSFGKTNSLCITNSSLKCDLNNDSNVNNEDLSLLITGFSKPVTTPEPPPVSTGSLIKNNCAPAAAASDGTMVWDSTDTVNKEEFDAYIGDGNCNGSLLLPAYDGNRGAADITADGRYVLLVTAVGWDKSISWAQPGKGSSNAIQLYDRQTARLTTLLPSGTPAQQGVIWPKFNHNATKIVWAQMIKNTFVAPPIGAWQLHVADLNLAAGTISNNRVWQEAGIENALYEPYGWLPGTNKIIYITTARSSAQDTTAFQLFTIPDNLPAGQQGTRISPPIDAFWPWETARDAYHEFAHFNPNDPNTLYTSVGAAALGADLWKYDLRSANSSGLLAQPQRISYFGGNYRAPAGQQAVAGWPAPQYSIVGGMAWVNNGWVAGVCREDSCANIDAYRINP